MSKQSGVKIKLLEKDPVQDSPEAGSSILQFPTSTLPDFRRSLHSGSTFNSECSADLRQFHTAYEGEYCKFELRPGIHGYREVQFTLKSGIIFLDSAAREINNAMENAPNYPPGFKIYLSGNTYKNLPKTSDIVIIYTPVVKDSGNRVREGSDPETSHQGLLDSLNLEFVPNDIHRLACGAMRVAQGFPLNRLFLGGSVEFDRGDLNEGSVIRTAAGKPSGLVGTYPTGIRTHDWRDNIKFPSLKVAGMSYRSF